MDPTALVLTLSSGRNLGYAIYGNPSPQAPTIFYFHSSPSSRLEAAILHQPAQQHGLRIVSVDRPGMGLSTYQEHRTIISFAADINEIADQLQIPRFSILAYSSGVSYALACVKMLPASRLVCVGVMGGQYPTGVKGPWFMKPVQKYINKGISSAVGSSLDSNFGKLARQVDPTAFYEYMTKQMEHRPEIDRRSLEGREKVALFDPQREAFRQDGRGIGEEIRLQAEKWGYEFHEINATKLQGGVLLWHGAKDELVPVGLAQGVAQEIFGCKFQVLPGMGHVGIQIHHSREVMNWFTVQMGVQQQPQQH